MVHIISNLEKPPSYHPLPAAHQTIAVLFAKQILLISLQQTPLTAKHNSLFKRLSTAFSPSHRRIRDFFPIPHETEQTPQEAQADHNAGHAVTCCCEWQGLV